MPKLCHQASLPVTRLRRRLNPSRTMRDLSSTTTAIDMDIINSTELLAQSF